MPDHDRFAIATPRGWSDAFAALPLETPDAGGWQRLERARTPGSAQRWPAWGALAAMLALAALLPRQLIPTQHAARGAAELASSAPDPQAQTARAPAMAGAGVGPRTGGTGAPVTAPPSRTLSAGLLATRGPRVEPAPTELAPQRSKPARNGLADAGQSRVASSDTADVVGIEARSTARQAASPADASLEALYTQSAQLEALLALARDDRVATGASAALTDAYDAQLAAIDAALREPAVADGERSALWQQRVDTLRKFAGFESTQRALAASGERYDAMLVSID